VKRAGAVSLTHTGAGEECEGYYYAVLSEPTPVLGLTPIALAILR